MATEVPRLLFVHAHPDDESINNGATISHYATRGATVHVVTCTLGEEGEAIGDHWAQLAVDHADQLGGYRIGELTAALHLLGIGEPIFLGGAGRWRDSGMAGTQSVSRTQPFVDSGEEAVAALVDIIRTLRPHVVVTYDPNGGYGHPDHIRAHEVTTAAVAGAGADGRPGRPWAVPKFYWTANAKSAFTAAAGTLTADDLLPHWQLPVRGRRRNRLRRRSDHHPCRRHRRAARQGGRAQRPCHPGGRRPDGAGVCVVEQPGAAHPRSRALHPGVR